MALIYHVGGKQDWLYLQIIRKHEPELWAATRRLIQAQAAELESRDPKSPGAA